MVSEDWAYLAGIIDGEGCIQLHQHYQSKGSFAPILIITNTDVRIIDWVCSEFPGGAVSCQVYKEGNNKPRYQWRIYGAKCMELLEGVRPYLFLKAEAADELLAFWRLRARYNFGSGIRAPEEYITEAEAIREAISILNKRGIN